MEGVPLGGIALQYVMRRKKVGGLDFNRDDACWWLNIVE